MVFTDFSEGFGFPVFASQWLLLAVTVLLLWIEFIIQSIKPPWEGVSVRSSGQILR